MDGAEVDFYEEDGEPVQGVEYFDETMEEEAGFDAFQQLNWSGLNNAASNRPTHRSETAPPPVPLLPNCVALVFKQNNCAIHLEHHLQFLAQNNNCQACSSRLMTLMPQQPLQQQVDYTCAQQQQIQMQKVSQKHVISSDLGYRLFKSFRDTNRKILFWHRDLAKCLRRIEYVGFIFPCTLLVSTAGGDEWLEVLKRCWSQQLLISPPSYSLESVGHVTGCSMYPVCQSAAVNLIDAICGVICDLAFTSLPSTLDVIFASVTSKYSSCGADIPPIEVFHDMLSFLVAKKRVVITMNGSFRMASKESFDKRRREKLQRQRQHILVGGGGGDQNHHQHPNQQQYEMIDTPVDETAVSRHHPHNSSIIRRFKRRFFGRAKGGDSTPPLLPFNNNNHGLPDGDRAYCQQPNLANNISNSQQQQQQQLAHCPNLMPYRGANHFQQTHVDPLQAPARNPSESAQQQHHHHHQQHSKPPGLFNCYNTGLFACFLCSYCFFLSPSLFYLCIFCL